MKAAQAKETDLAIGQQMNQAAEEHKALDAMFKDEKKKKATELLTQHWDEQQTLKDNAGMVNRVFE